LDSSNLGDLSSQETFYCLEGKKIPLFCKEQSPEINMVFCRIFRSRSCCFTESNGWTADILSQRRVGSGNMPMDEVYGKKMVESVRNV